nr:hypothetical protein [Frankia casuarinae]
MTRVPRTVFGSLNTGTRPVSDVVTLTSVRRIEMRPASRSTADQASPSASPRRTPVVAR